MPDIKITFKIKEINVDKFAINLPNIKKSEIENEYTFNVRTRFSVDPDTREINWIILTEIFLDKERTDLCCEINTSFKYEIVNLSAVTTRKSNLITIPDPILNLLLQMSLDTTRGILLEKTNGTPMQKVFFPLLNPVDIIKQIKELNQQK